MSEQQITRMSTGLMIAKARQRASPTSQLGMELTQSEEKDDQEEEETSPAVEAALEMANDFADKNEISEFLVFLKSMRVEERGRVLENLRTHLWEGRLVQDYKMEQLWEYVDNDDELSGFYGGEDQKAKIWEDIEAIAFQSRQRRRDQESFKRILKYWPEREATALIGPNPSQNFVKRVAQMAGKCPDPGTGMAYLELARQNRLENPGRGISNKPSFQPKDVENACKMIDAGSAVDTPPHTQEIRRPRPMLIEDMPMRSRAVENIPTGIKVLEGPSLVVNEGEKRKASVLEERTPSKRRRSSRQAEKIRIMYPGRGARPEKSQPSRVDMRATAIENLFRRERQEDAGLTDSEYETEDDESDEDETVERRTTVTLRKDCRCDPQIPRKWLASIGAKKKGYGNNDKYFTELGVFTKFTRRGLRVCHKHLVYVGGHVGLMVKGLKAKELQERLHKVWDNRGNLLTLKTDKETWRWFRKAERPPRAIDALGPYRLQPLPEKPFVYDGQEVMGKLGLEEHGVTFQRDGSVVIGNVLGWWVRHGLTEQFRQETDMYCHHLREMNGMPNYGWVRNMYYSIGQQLMRQDPIFYLLYCCLRDDNTWKVVCYPYYGKKSVPSDSTFFRHIDINLRKRVEDGRGTNSLQTSVSLTNETSKTCTEILAGFHNVLDDWFAEFGNQLKTGGVGRFDEKLCPAEAREKWGLEWKTQVCPEGGVRISRAEIPHGATGCTDVVRYTYLPWPFAEGDLDKDGQPSLEVDGMRDTPEDLANATRRLVAPKGHPTSEPDHHGLPPYSFPASVHVTGLGALSDALVGRIPWDHPSVKYERDLLFLETGSTRVQQWLRDWREKATKVAKEAWERVQILEKLHYGDKSWGAGGEVNDDTEDVAPDLEEAGKHRSVALSLADFEDDDFVAVTEGWLQGENGERSEESGTALKRALKTRAGRSVSTTTEGTSDALDSEYVSEDDEIDPRDQEEDLEELDMT